MRMVFALVAAVALLACSAFPAGAQGCAQPVSTGAAPVASDCLFILGAAVGSQTCSPACLCAPTGTLPTKATDALLCLSAATGQPVVLDCPCDEEPPTDGPIGFVTASHSVGILPGFLPGLPATITEDLSLGGWFQKLTGNVPLPEVTRTEETIAGCTVVTIESTQTVSPDDPPPSVVNYDPGDPGVADNGSVNVDLVRESAQGFESFAPQGDPLALGFDAGQTIEFSWPGGDDIDPFSDTIAVPPAVEITTPDLESTSFDVDPGDAVSVEWVPGADEDGKIAIELFTSITEFLQEQDGSSTINVDSVTVQCLFTDSAGSGTVPGAATARLQAAASLPLIYSKSFAALRSNSKSVGVTAPTAGGSRSVLFSGTSSVTRSLAAAFPFP
jgi:hypothetical protein